MSDNFTPSPLRFTSIKDNKLIISNFFRVNVEIKEGINELPLEICNLIILFFGQNDKRINFWNMYKGDTDIYQKDTNTLYFNSKNKAEWLGHSVQSLYLRVDGSYSFSYRVPFSIGMHIGIHEDSHKGAWEYDDKNQLIELHGKSYQGTENNFVKEELHKCIDIYQLKKKNQHWDIKPFNF